jgi:hypothetical protein
VEQNFRADWFGENRGFVVRLLFKAVQYLYVPGEEEHLALWAYDLEPTSQLKPRHNRHQNVRYD